MDISLLDRPIAFHRCLVTITGSITAALMLSQALYWQRRCKHPEGWWYKTRNDWYEETGMRRREQEGARRRLRQLGLLQEDRRGVPAQLWYRVDEHRLLDLLMQSSKTKDVAPAGKPETGSPVGGKPAVQLVENRPTGWLETSQLDGAKPPNKVAQFQPTIPFNPETTTETLSETTTTTTATAAQPNVSEPTNGEAGSSSSSEKEAELILDGALEKLSTAERERAIKIVSKAGDQAQAVLDELNDLVSSNGVKKSKWAVLAGMVKRVQEGTFTPTSERGEQRAKQQAIQAAIRESQRKAEEQALQRLKENTQGEPLASPERLLKQRPEGLQELLRMVGKKC